MHRPLIFLFGGWMSVLAMVGCEPEVTGADAALWQHLPVGVWQITSLQTDTGDATSEFRDYRLDFKVNQNVYVTGPEEFDGLWWVTDSTAGLTTIEFSFSAASPMSRLSGEWIENTRTDDVVRFDRLYGTTDVLELTRQ
jgi:hypothetical protein